VGLRRRHRHRLSREQPRQRFPLRKPKRPVGLIAHFGRRVDAEAPEDGGGDVGGCDRILGGVAGGSVAGAMATGGDAIVHLTFKRKLPRWAV
jgi:hypothetical protein